MMGKWRVKPWLGRNVSGFITSWQSWHKLNNSIHTWTWGIRNFINCLLHTEHSFSQACQSFSQFGPAGNRLIEQSPHTPRAQKRELRAWTSGSRVYTTGSSLKTDDIFSLEEMLQDSLDFLSPFFEQREGRQKNCSSGHLNERRTLLLRAHLYASLWVKSVKQEIRGELDKCEAEKLPENRIHCRSTSSLQIILEVRHFTERSKKKKNKTQNPVFL